MGTYHLCLVPKHFLPPDRNSPSREQSFPIPSFLALATTALLAVYALGYSGRFTGLEPTRELWVCLLAYSTPSCGLVHQSPVLLVAEKYSAVGTDHTLFTCSPVDGLWGCFCFVAVVSSDAVRVWCPILSECVFSVLLGTHPGVELLGAPVSNSEDLPRCPHGSCTIFHLHQHHRSQLHTLTHICHFPFILLIAVLVGVKCYLVVGLITFP